MALTKINSDGVKDDSIVNADIKSDAAIAGSKINPDFGSQNITTTGNLGVGVAATSTEFLFIQTPSGSSGNNTTKAGIVVKDGSYADGALIDCQDSVGGSVFKVLSNGDINIHNRTAAASTDPVTIDFGGQYTPDASITHQNLKVKLFSNASGNDAGGLTMGQSGVSYVSSVGAGHLFYTAPSAVDTLIERLRITSDGKIGIGTTSPDKSLTIGGSNPVIKLNDGNGRILELRGGSTTHNPGLVTGYASGLYLGSNGTESVVVGEEHLTITDGNLVVASGHGIDFSLSPDIATGETTTSQILDDYEEGNFNVNYKTGAANSNTLSAAAYTTTGGLYTKVGNIVHFQIRLKCTSATTVGGQIVIEGLPFTQISSNITSGAYVVCPEMLGSSNDTRLLIDGTVIKFQTLAGGVLGSSAGGLDFTGEFHCAGTYIAT